MFTRILAGLAGMALATSLLAAEPIRPPDLNATQVTLPYSELKALWQAANRAASAKRKPPVEAALLSARYQLSLKGDIAAGVVDYEVENFTEEWTTIPLLGVQTPVDEIEPADVQLIIREGRYAVVTNRPGKQKLRLKFAVKRSSLASWGCCSTLSQKLTHSRSFCRPSITVLPSPAGNGP